MIQPGDAVTIRAPHRPARHGRVIALQHVDELPADPQAQTLTEVRSLLYEMGVDLVALLSCKDGRNETMLAAVRIGDRWYDLRRQRLRLTQRDPR